MTRLEKLNSRTLEQMEKDRVDLVKGSSDDFGGGFSSEESRDR